MPTMTYTETLTITSCWCGINLAVPDNLYRFAQQRDDRAIYCPLGHRFYFTETFEEKLKREQRRHQATRDLLAAEERSHTATKGHLTKQKKRAAAALCPCCNRHFVNVERHLATKHPDYVKEALHV